MKGIQLLKNFRKEGAECFVKYGKLGITYGSLKSILNPHMKTIYSEEKYEITNTDRATL